MSAPANRAGANPVNFSASVGAVSNTANTQFNSAPAPQPAISNASSLREPTTTAPQLAALAEAASPAPATPALPNNIFPMTPGQEARMDAMLAELQPEPTRVEPTREERVATLAEVLQREAEKPVQPLPQQLAQPLQPLHGAAADAQLALAQLNSNVAAREYLVQHLEQIKQARPDLQQEPFYFSRYADKNNALKCSQNQLATKEGNNLACFRYAHGIQYRGQVSANYRDPRNSIVPDGFGVVSTNFPNSDIAKNYDVVLMNQGKVIGSFMLSQRNGQLQLEKFQPCTIEDLRLQGTKNIETAVAATQQQQISLGAHAGFRAAAHTPPPAEKNRHISAWRTNVTRDAPPQQASPMPDASPAPSSTDDVRRRASADDNDPAAKRLKK